VNIFVWKEEEALKIEEEDISIERSMISQTLLVSWKYRKNGKKERDQKHFLQFCWTNLARKKT
jgi:hypothetical protein